MRAGEHKASRAERIFIGELGRTGNASPASGASGEREGASTGRSGRAVWGLGIGEVWAEVGGKRRRLRQARSEWRAGEGLPVAQQWPTYLTGGSEGRGGRSLGEEGEAESGERGEAGCWRARKRRRRGDGRPSRFNYYVQAGERMLACWTRAAPLRTTKSRTTHPRASFLLGPRASSAPGSPGPSTRVCRPHQSPLAASRPMSFRPPCVFSPSGGIVRQSFLASRVSLRNRMLRL